MLTQLSWQRQRAGRYGLLYSERLVSLSSDVSRAVASADFSYNMGGLCLPEVVFQLQHLKGTYEQQEDGRLHSLTEQWGMAGS